MIEKQVATLQVRFDIPESLARVLVLLATNQTVTPQMVAAENITRYAPVAMHRLRQAILGTGIVIKSRRGLGYWLEKEDRDIILKKMIPDQMELPLVGGGDSGSEAAH